MSQIYLPHRRKAFQAAGPSYLIEENCEGTTEDSWTDSGTVNWDDTTPTPPEGSECVQLDSGSNSTSPTFTAQSSCWGFFRVYLPTASGNAEIFTFRDSSSELGRLQFRSTGAFRINHGGASDNSGTPTTGQWIYVWIEWAESTGSDGVMRIYYSTGSTRPGAAQGEVTTGTASGTCDRIRINGHANTMHFDRILVSSDSIGDDP